MRGRGQPGAALIVDPPALAPAVFDHLGNFSWYGASYGTPSVTLQKDGFGALPGLSLPAEKDSTALLVLPPADDLIVNGQFETGVPSGWSATNRWLACMIWRRSYRQPFGRGQKPAVQGGRSSLFAHRLPPRKFLAIAMAGCMPSGRAAPRDKSFITPTGPRTASGPLQWCWAHGLLTHKWPEQRRHPDGGVVRDAALTWQFAACPLYDPNAGGRKLECAGSNHLCLRADQQFLWPPPAPERGWAGRAAPAFATDMGVWYMHQPFRRQLEGVRSGAGSGLGAANAGRGGWQVHFLWQLQGSISRQLYYARLSLDGSLTQEMLPFSSFDNYPLALNATGDPTVLMQQWFYGIYASQRLPEGGWSDPVTVKAISDQTTITLTDVRFGPDGRLFAAWYEYSSNTNPVVNDAFLAVRGLDGQWSAPVRYYKESGKIATRLSLFIDGAGSVHGVWLVADGLGVAGSILYTGLACRSVDNPPQPERLDPGRHAGGYSFVPLPGEPAV